MSNIPMPTPGAYVLQSLNGDFLANRVNASFSDQMGGSISLSASMVDTPKGSTPKDALKAAIRTAFEGALKALDA